MRMFTGEDRGEATVRANLPDRTLIVQDVGEVANMIFCEDEP